MDVMIKRPSFQDGIVSLLVIVTTIATPMAFIELGVVTADRIYSLAGWTFVFGCVQSHSGVLILTWPYHDWGFSSFLTLVGIWILVALFLFAVVLFVNRFKISIVGSILTLVLQAYAPLRLLAGYPAIFVMPFPIPSIVALIGLLVLRQNLPFRRWRLRRGARIREEDDEEQAKEKPRLVVRRLFTRQCMKKRVLVIFFLAYYIWLLWSAYSMRGWWWEPETGLMWSSGGPGMFFPFPLLPGIAAIITYASPFDQVFYLLFMHGGIWAFWVGIGLLYIISPYKLNPSYLSSGRAEDDESENISISRTYVVYSQMRELLVNRFRRRNRPKNT